jgi:pimeloyl-ACP methyl ester carboxylesterase
MKLVMVHGRAQEGQDPVVLKKEWMDALGYGAARANVGIPPGTTVAFPYYGDRLVALLAELATPLGMEINAKGPNPDADQVLRDIAVAVGVTDDDVRRELAGAPTPKGPRNWEWVQATLRAIDRIPGLNSHAIDLFTRDVYAYLQYPGIRAAIDGIVRAAIGNDPCVVLAHSLGTVVAYNVLVQRDPAPPLPRLVTVGSPLGIRGIKRKLDPPLRHPACVTHWFNAYDDRDVVALVPLDARNFDVTPPVENKSDVMNFTDNRHGIAGYLADPVVARRVVELLAAP